MVARKLLNYTTSVAVEKTISEIETILANHGATKILKDFDEGVCTAISFMIKTDQGLLPFRLPADNRQAVAALNEVIDNWKPAKYGQSRPIPKRLRGDKEHAAKVAWRIIKDWLEAQLAIIQMKQAKVEQVFLPYLVDPSGHTLYEKMIQRKFEGYLLQDGHQELDSDYRH